MLRRSSWRVLTLMMIAGAVAASGQTNASAPLPRLPEGDAGIAAKYPGDAGIESDPRYFSMMASRRTRRRRTIHKLWALCIMRDTFMHG